MPLILDLWSADGTWIPLVAEDKVMEVLLVVNLVDHLGQTLRDKGSILRLHRADTKTLAKEQLLAEGSCNVLAHYLPNWRETTIGKHAMRTSQLTKLLLL